MVVQDAEAAAAAVQRLKDDDAGRAALLLAGAWLTAHPGLCFPAPAADSAIDSAQLPAGARWAAELVTASQAPGTPPCPPCSTGFF